jgi:hypothetical protein
MLCKGGDIISSKSKNQIEGFVLGECKRLIIEDFQNNSNIVSLILGLNQPVITLKNKNVFDQAVIPESQLDAKTYITMESVILNSGQSIKCIEITLNVFTDLTLVSLTPQEKGFYYPQGFMGTRIDVLCDAIIRCMKGSTKYGIGEVELRPSRTMWITQPTPKYYGKGIAFHVYDF